MWRSAARAVLILLLGVCVVGLAAADAQAARLAIMAALLPWMLFLVWHGVRGRHELLWLALLPFAIAAVLLWLLAPFGSATPRLFPMQGLAVVGRTTPEAYSLRVTCDPSRGVCATAHDLTLGAVSLELAGHSVEPSRSGWLVREVVVAPIATVRVAQLPAGFSVPGLPRAPAAGVDEGALLAIGDGRVCVALGGLPPGALLAIRGGSAAPRVERAGSGDVQVTWCADSAREGLRFAYAQPPWQSLAWLLRPLQGISATVAALLAALLSLATILVRRQR